ncbi:MAG: hypothetical protein LBI57_00915 [Helicobacteraceae bacterium]|jgi:hypothetical protein|nr:hypothetical protein [Helicobacteraceae bacterium]
MIRRVVVLLSLCVGALFADSVAQLDRFVVSSVLQPEGATLEIYHKDGEMFQEIVYDSDGYCDADFLFNNVEGEERSDSIGFICESQYSAVEYSYDPKEKQYVYAGPIEHISLDEIAELKDFYILLSFDYMKADKPEYGNVIVFQKPSNRIAQTIGLDYKGAAQICEGMCLAVNDYNSDGFSDFSLFAGDYEHENRVYFSYDPKKGGFFLSEIEERDLESE